MAGQFGGWGFIGAEATAGGYEVALKLAGAEQYALWNTDSNGNYLSGGSILAATDPTLESAEITLHQDLNGDGTIGIPGRIVIESFGSTYLTEVGNNFYLDSSSGVGPSLKLSGANVVAGQFGGWGFIGAETTAGGYEVALKLAGAEQYAVWNTDSNGNYLSGGSILAATDPTLESAEITLHQDLNGDGTIGIPGRIVIESFGSTYLTEVGNNFYLDSSSGIGPSLKLSGANVVAGQFGGWGFIGAEATAGGYEVALKAYGCRAVCCLAHRQQRPLSLGRHRCGGNRSYHRICRDYFAPGSEWRWDNWYPWQRNGQRCWRRHLNGPGARHCGKRSAFNASRPWSIKWRFCFR